MSDTVFNSLRHLAASPSLGRQSETAHSGNWFEAMSKAWGETLDHTAQRVAAMSDQISGGEDSPAAITQLSSESLRMSFLSSSAHTSISSVGSALETMARKQ